MTATPRACPYSQVALKKGIAAAPLITWNAAQQQAALTDLNPAYWYNYDLVRNGVSYPKFCPMFTATAQVTNVNIDAASALAMGVDGHGWLMFYNEPDQIGITNADCISTWNTLVARLATIGSPVKVLSPAVTAGQLVAYMDPFLAGITRQPDAIAIHAYGTGATTNPQAQVQQTNTTIGSYTTKYPTFDNWVTEFASYDGLGTVPAWTDQQMYCERMCQWHELRTSTTHYSYWVMGPQTRPQEAAFPRNYLYDDAVLITPLGQTYQDNLFSKHPAMVV